MDKRTDGETDKQLLVDAPADLSGRGIKTSKVKQQVVDFYQIRRAI